MSASHCANSSRSRAGFTLVEMLVVVTILAVLALAAVTSLEPIADQARYEATTRTLAQIQQAIVGERGAQQPDGVPLIAGFVADVGRLPVSLDELITQPANADDFDLKSAPAPHTAVTIPRGWRGPYLQLPNGETQAKDGWGQPFEFIPFLAGPPTMPLSVASPLAPRADTDYAGPISISIGTTAPTAWQATMITGKVYSLNSGQRIPPSGTWQVSLIGPGPLGTDDGVRVQAATVTLDPTTSEVTYTFNSSTSSLTIGPRALRASNGSSTTPYPVYLTVRPGATHVVDLLVQ